MKERGIPFNATMVRAILAGAKTQTRRVVHQAIVSDISGKGENVLHRCPYGVPGDRLWVREAYRVSNQWDRTPPRELRPRKMTVVYEAGGSSSNCVVDGVERWQEEPDFPGDRPPDWIGKLRPGMFMCRWMSRITLEVTGVRVERLCDICHDDAIDEGYPIPRDATRGPLRWYRDLWIDINGEASWHANPWVWVVEFERQLN